MKRFLVVLGLSLVAVLPITSCEGGNGDAPIGIACALCEMLDQVGICDMVQGISPLSLEVAEVPECEEGESLYITNLKEVFENKEAVNLECK